MVHSYITLIRGITCGAHFDVMYTPRCGGGAMTPTTIRGEDLERTLSSTWRHVTLHITKLHIIPNVLFRNAPIAIAPHNIT